MRDHETGKGCCAREKSGRGRDCIVSHPNSIADVFVQWTFENAQFSEGGALTGFDFDATIGAVTDWSVAFPGRLAIPRNHEIKFQTCFTIGASEERLKRHERIES